jgi:hypothetical protein
MPGMLVAAALLLLAGADGAEAAPPPQQWYCAASAKGAHGSSFTVQFYVETDGKLVGRGILWTPPKIAQWPRNWRVGPLKIPVEPVSILIGYEDAGGAGPGAVSDVSGTAESRGGPKSLDGTTASLVLDGGQPRTIGFDKMTRTSDGVPEGYIPQFGEFAPVNKELLGAVETAHEAVIRLRNSHGRSLAWARYELSGHQERDRLFHQAWKEAAAAALHPTSCEKTEAQDMPTVPIHVNSPRN